MPEDFNDSPTSVGGGGTPDSSTGTPIDPSVNPDAGGTGQATGDTGATAEGTQGGAAGQKPNMISQEQFDRRFAKLKEESEGLERQLADTKRELEDLKPLKGVKDLAADLMQFGDTTEEILDVQKKITSGEWDQTKIDAHKATIRARRAERRADEEREARLATEQKLAQKDSDVYWQGVLERAVAAHPELDVQDLSGFLLANPKSDEKQLMAYAKKRSADLRTRFGATGSGEGRPSGAPTVIPAGTGNIQGDSKIDYGQMTEREATKLRKDQVRQLLQSGRGAPG